jgi:hypothetical protein
MIHWEPIKDRHVRGRSETCDIYIRVDREERVLGIYLMFGETEKWVPRLPSEETLPGAKRWAAELLNARLLSRK